MFRCYLDHNATTPAAPAALDAFTRASREAFGNASSIHQYGQTAKALLDQSKNQVAALLGCSRNEIVLTSGGTESDNLALFGAIRNQGTSSHVVTSAIEHPAVLNACRRLEQDGIEVTYVPVQANGAVDPDAVRRSIRPSTRLISVMHVNNETGVVQPIREISQIAREAGIAMHSDGVQAVGKLEVAVHDLALDMYSISGHKLYAPKGTGALFVGKGLELDPLIYGGRQESNRRAGTENVPGAAALGVAAELARSGLAQEGNRLRKLRDSLETKVLDQIPDVVVNGEAERVSSTSSLCFRGIEGEALVISLDLKGYSVSSGSACSSGAVEPSHVLLAMGLSRQDAKSSIRVSFGSSNTEEQVDGLVQALVQSVGHLRRLSPMYSYA